MPHEQPPYSGRLLGLVEAILAKNASDGAWRRPQVVVDGDLVDVGMTSVDMVSLMLAVEAEFDMAIPSSDITPQNFRSISTIDALLCRLDRYRVSASS
jgi:acyl carrier protein